MLKKNTGVWGRSPQKILTYFEVKNDFAIHEFTPENPVTFQKSGVAGEGVKPLCTMGKQILRTMYHIYASK